MPKVATKAVSSFLATLRGDATFVETPLLFTAPFAERDGAAFFAGDFFWTVFLDFTGFTGFFTATARFAGTAFSFLADLPFCPSTFAGTFFAGAFFCFLFAFLVTAMASPEYNSTI
jgi:hypothetical protein